MITAAIATALSQRPSPPLYLTLAQRYATPDDVFLVSNVRNLMQRESQYPALPKSSWFGRTRPAEPTVILIRNL
jgi:hypothetical protein